MQSMRDNASRLRFDLEPLSLRELTSAFQCDPSLAAVCALPEKVEMSGSFHKNDVSCAFTLVLESNGLWVIAADFHDSGAVFGDEFSAVISIQVEGDPAGKALTYHGTLKAKHRAHWSEAGMEPSFAQHWRAITEGRLKIDPHLETELITEEILLGVQLGMGLPLLVISGSALAGKKKTCDWVRPTEPGPLGVDYSCTFDLDTPASGP